MKPYELPELPYEYGALEPHISAAIMELHHGKHHKAYVDGANETLEKLAEARGKEDFSAIAALEHALAFNVSGHVLHSIFWENLAPGAGGKPVGDLAAAIERDLGGFASFQEQLTQAAATCMGSGWGVLAWEPQAARLVTLQLHDHEAGGIQGSVPLMVLDAWEHAYYLQYRNEKARYFTAVWNLWNWDDIGARYAKARR